MLTDKEFLALLDYALDKLVDFEQAVDAFCASMRGE